MTQAKVTFDPSPKKKPLPRFPAHFLCKKSPDLIVLALNHTTNIMVRPGGRDEKPGEVITAHLSPFSDESIWKRVPGESTFSFETE